MDSGKLVHIICVDETNVVSNGAVPDTQRDTMMRPVIIDIKCMLLITGLVRGD